MPLDASEASTQPPSPAVVLRGPGPLSRPGGSVSLLWLRPSRLCLEPRPLPALLAVQLEGTPRPTAHLSLCPLPGPGPAPPKGPRGPLPLFLAFATNTAGVSCWLPVFQGGPIFCWSEGHLTRVLSGVVSAVGPGVPSTGTFPPARMCRSCRRVSSAKPSGNSLSR